MASTAWIDELKVKDLKDELKNRGLSVSGKKAELADRLREHIEQQEVRFFAPSRFIVITTRSMNQAVSEAYVILPLHRPVVAMSSKTKALPNSSRSSSRMTRQQHRRCNLLQTWTRSPKLMISS